MCLYMCTWDVGRRACRPRAPFVSSSVSISSPMPQHTYGLQRCHTVYGTLAYALYIAKQSMDIMYRTPKLPPILFNPAGWSVLCANNCFTASVVLLGHCLTASMSTTSWVFNLWFWYNQLYIYARDCDRRKLASPAQCRNTRMVWKGVILCVVHWHTYYSWSSNGYYVQDSQTSYNYTILF